MRCREILYTPHCSQRAREFPRSVNFSLQRMFAELRGINVAQFSDVGLFSPHITPKTYLLVTRPQPRGFIAEWLRFFHVVVEGPKSCSTFFLRLLVGELGTPKLAQNFAYSKWLYPHRILLHSASDLDVLSHQISLPLLPKSPQNPILGDLLVQTLL